MASNDIFDEDFLQATNELCVLLGRNISELKFTELKRLIKQRSLSWHPDKNKDNPRKAILEEQLKRLNAAWTTYKLLTPGTSQECNSSEESDKDSDIFSTEKSKDDSFSECMGEKNGEDFYASWNTSYSSEFF
ncbi:hypothetical protein HNY73_006070 [Argiope bruennichi]|uniref:J domain-containing protein n=1 Tax=Argiope bruennichi TaxID=94029 RepID=A0A8T0FKZ5_ARGBR|nr:hypothetical protein HNY73_006070 [Argiope bruennichi]